MCKAADVHAAVLMSSQSMASLMVYSDTGDVIVSSKAALSGICMWVVIHYESVVYIVHWNCTCKVRGHPGHNLRDSQLNYNGIIENTTRIRIHSDADSQFFRLASLPCPFPCGLHVHVTKSMLLDAILLIVKFSSLKIFCRRPFPMKIKHTKCFA